MSSETSRAEALNGRGDSPEEPFSARWKSLTTTSLDEEFFRRSPSVESRVERPSTIVCLKKTTSSIERTNEEKRKDPHWPVFSVFLLVRRWSFSTRRGRAGRSRCEGGPSTGRVRRSADREERCPNGIHRGRFPIPPVRCSCRRPTNEGEK